MNLGKIWQYLGIAWSLAAAVTAAAFFFGGEWSNWQDVKKRVLVDDAIGAKSVDLNPINKELERLNGRIDGIRLVAENMPNSPGYGCNVEQKAESGSLVVMSGIKDGTGCDQKSVNFYKRLELKIPAD